MSNFPAGSEDDKNAPWNETNELTKECEDCAGRGFNYGYAPPESELKDYEELCDICKGSGIIDIEKDEGDDDKD